MFAVKRRLKTKGRIIWLVSSIALNKGSKMKGIPLGLRWAKNF